MQIMKFYGQNDDPEQFCKFLDEFKNLRGDTGLREDKNLVQKLRPDITKLHQQLKNRKKLQENTHSMFVRGKKKRDKA